MSLNTREKEPSVLKKKKKKLNSIEGLKWQEKVFLRIFLAYNLTCHSLDVPKVQLKYERKFKSFIWEVIPE
jgi:hypothetical protein